MMLQALAAYAEREGLGDAEFEDRETHYELRITSEGRFAGLVPLERHRQRIPKPPSNNNPGGRRFLVASAEYVLGTPKEGAIAGNAERCLAAYRSLIASARETKDDALVALHRFLESDDAREEADRDLARSEDADADTRAGRVLVPRLQGDATPIHERAAAREWWMRLCREQSAATSLQRRRRCLVLGEMLPAAEIHDFIKGVPGGRPSGTKLVSFEADAFTSHGLEKGLNAPVSDVAMVRYVAALNSLLARRADGRRESALDLDGDVVVFWTRDRSDAPKFVLDVWSSPLDGNDATAAAASPWRGVRPAFDPTKFYAVTLGANGPRLVVRDWFETTADKVGENLTRWFDDVRLGDAPTESIPIARMLRSLQAAPSARGDKRGIPPGLAARLFRAALTGGPIPRALLATAVQRMRVPPGERESRFVLRDRVAVIKAVLVRDPNHKKEVSVSLDESNIDRAYLLGRLFAAIEKLQLVASGRGNDLNATIRDRYYGSASTNPASVFGRLLSLSMHHASKARDDGLGRVAERAKSDVMSKLPAARFPRVLSLDEQGLFAVGYYHQREAFFRKKDDAGGGKES